METNKNLALARAGIRPSDWGMRKGTQAHFNKRRAEKMGRPKHKTREYN